MKTIVMLALVALMGTAVIGCRGEAELDVDERAPISLPR